MLNTKKELLQSFKSKARDTLLEERPRADSLQVQRGFSEKYCKKLTCEFVWDNIIPSRH